MIRPAPTPPARRFALSPELLNLIVVLYILAVQNRTLFARIADLAPDPATLALLILMTFGLTLASVTLFTCFGAVWLHKLALAALLILSAITAWFTDTLGAVFDEQTVNAVYATNGGEISALTNSDIVLYACLTGLLPALIVLALPVKRRGLIRNGLIWLATFVLGLAVFVGARQIGHEGFNRATRGEVASVSYALQPAAFLVGSAKLLIDQWQILGLPFQQIGLDAKTGGLAARSGKPNVVFLVVGEAARSENHQIDGYDRPTNPMLSRADIVNFGPATSCNTSTIPSLRCMFSRAGRSDTRYVTFATTENLLDVAAHAGVAVEWYDNDWTYSGAGVATRIAVDRLYQRDDPAFCQTGGQTGECLDTIFLPVLDQVIAETTGPKLVVFHLAGSHFPYVRRYPPDFATFAPACTATSAADCTPAEIVNAYDNSIRFTDLVLGRMIQTLSHQDRITASILYTSDHGESLGENGVFMHSAPLASAPKQQTTVPFFLWFSPAARAAMDLNIPCLQAKANGTISHDNLFPTVLGLLDIQTRDRNPVLDLTSGCTSLN